MNVYLNESLHGFKPEEMNVNDNESSKKTDQHAQLVLYHRGMPLLI